MNLIHNKMNLQGMVQGYVTDAIAAKVGQSVGLSPEISRMLAGKVMPLFMSKMANNTQDEKQAAGLFGAIKNDHDGSVFEEGKMAEVLAGNGDEGGAKILSHIFGGQTQAIEQAVAADAHVEPAQAQGFMEKLAPLMMGAMGKEQTAQGLDMGSIIGSLMETKQAQAPQAASNPLLGLLDKQGDGVTDDLLKMGMSFLNKRS